MKFDKTNLKEIREDFQCVVKDIEEKYGIIITMGNISYSALEFTTKLTVTSNETISEDFERKEFEKYCSAYGLKKEDYGRTFRNGGKEYKLIGFELSRPKYCIKVRGEDGKVGFFTEYAILGFKDYKLTKTDTKGNPI